MRTIKIICTVLILCSFIFPIHTSAHQSGCHRWHSCPSDTGSYECGDLGYDSYCDEETYYEEPDYAAQGDENGLDSATEDNTSIVQAAETEGDSAGYSDGREGSLENISPDAGITCNKTFTFNGFAPQEYQDAFHDAYSSACTDSYNEAFSSAYTIGYERGAAEYEAKGESNDSSAESSDGGWVWPSILGGGVIWYGASVVNQARKKKKR
jgi:hypothetical protein